MKANLDECHLLLSTSKVFNLQISEIAIHNSHERKLLGVALDNKLTFKKHITTKTELSGESEPLQKRRILMNAFFNSKFNYPVI